MKSDRHPRTGFLWQVVSIAAPVVILSGIAIYSLRWDRASIEQEARERAQNLISILAGQWQESARKELETFLEDRYLVGYLRAALRPLPQIRCRIVDGRIEEPVDYPVLPNPPAWIHELSPKQMEALQAADSAIYRLRNPAAARQALANMKAALHPEMALAGTELGILLLEAPDSAANLTARLIDLARRYPKSLSASGTPIADLALLRALRALPAGAPADALRQELFQRVTKHPSFLTPELIAAAKSASFNAQIVQTLEEIWHAQERARALLRPILKAPEDPSRKVTEMWLQGEDQLFFAQRTSESPGQNYSVILIPGRLLDQALLNALNATREQIPAYMSAEVEIGSKRWSVQSGLESSDALLLEKALLNALNESRALQGRLESSNTSAAGSRLASWSGTIHATKIKNAVYSMRDSSLGLLAPPDSLQIALTLNLTLARPDLLYASYRQRLWLVCALILAAAAAAGIGLLSAWRAFQRQMRLAEMTSNFVSSVSHELRAPLASVRLMAESLDKGRVESDEKRKVYFSLLVQECRRLSSLVENVLDFSRIHQGRKRYEFEPVDFVALILQTITLMQPIATEHQIQILFMAPSDEKPDAQPSWDGQAVQQALVNLVDNAIKHSPVGSVIKVGYGLSVDGKIRITVDDQGPGIPAEDQERIFESFYRRGSELRRETKGIGIGLSIVKHVAEGHSGRVFVESNPGQGGRLTLELPVTPQTRG